MSATPGRPSIVDVLPVVRAYYAKPGNGVGGHLHLVLDNKNVKDSNVRYCMQEAEAAGDADGVALAQLLLQLSKTQRLKLASLV